MTATKCLPNSQSTFRVAVAMPNVPYPQVFVVDPVVDQVAPYCEVSRSVLKVPQREY